jgi:hypothetical protein
MSLQHIPLSLESGNIPKGGGVCLRTNDKIPNVLILEGNT